VTAEIPKIVQQIGSGTASSAELEVAAAAGVAEITAGAVVCSFATGARAIANGCVLVIFTVGAGRCAGLGRMLMRAVSFFGPAWVPEPG
jgi:hypothetical protein